MSKEPPEDYTHQSQTRKNNPEVGLSAYDKERPKKQRYDFDPHLDPQLMWTNKTERASFEVPIISLLTQEKIVPKTIIKRYLKDPRFQATLDHFFKKLPLDKSIEFYQHDVDWANRLILGDSLLIMNSLINKEGMAGKIQTIYIDPPYGIGYSSNFQVSIPSVDVKDGQDNSLSREPEQIKAFRDTWELGIHSYLSYLRDRFYLSRMLLDDSGSIFVQIGIENVHFVRNLMDEIFGKENFCDMITIQKTSGFSTRYMPSISDYLLWYAKNKPQMKYHQLYLRKDINDIDSSLFRFVEESDGSRRTATHEEQMNPRLLPAGAKLYRISDLRSQGATQGSSSQPFVFEEKTYTPGKNAHWKTTINGLERLVQERRVQATSANIYYVRFFDDFPLTPLNNIWTDTGTGGYTDPKIYVVQTNTKIIQRCLLMTSDPGDIILDPTCGSGTAAYVAEQWGRRWITCDTSRIAVNLAKQRIMTAFYDYYRLSKDQTNLNFEYKTYPHVSLNTIGNEKDPKKEVLYDDPEIDASKIRVSGPFTLESISSSQMMISLDDALRRQETEGVEVQSFIEKVLFYLRHDGISYQGGKKLLLQDVQPYNRNFLHATAKTNDDKQEKVAISIGPEFGDVNLLQVEQAIYTALHEQFNWLLVVGFRFDEAAQIKLTRNKPDPSQLKCEMAFINPDIEIEDLQKKPSGVQMFTVFGQADLKVENIEGGYQVELIAVDTYNPQTGLIDNITPDQISAWFIDEDFDEHTFFIHQAIFPRATKFVKQMKKELKNLLDDSKLEFVKGKKSLPFKAGSNKRVAVKIVDNRGNELLQVIDLDK